MGVTIAALGRQGPFAGLSGAVRIQVQPKTK
jgi:hypothetical protein